MKKAIYSTLALTALLTCQYSGIYAQIGMNIDLRNEQVAIAGVNGNAGDVTHYLYDTWTKGSVKQADGKTFTDLDLMFNQDRSMVIFMSPEKHIAQAFAVPVTEFTIAAPAGTENGAIKKFQRGFNPIDGATAATYFEILADGNTKLLKRTEFKRVNEVAIGDIYPTRQIKPFDTYYASSNNVLIKVRREKKAILSLLKDKATDIDAYISANKLSVKDEQDLAKVFNYYNTL
ncbi:hypothetical protein [Mucilaginibacter sp. UYCu711]|uniref:hypothetical protein n=1 Tax=Mucilaginibacter sp. UYCu711 TaxID=3156339 RepID=UPI003D250A8D